MTKASGAPPLATVVIPTFNHPDHLRDCPRHLRREGVAPAAAAVVDASPDQRTRLVAREESLTPRYLRNSRESLSTASSRNLGLQIQGPPRVNANVLAADPAWLTESVLSYYLFGHRIVVSYDQDTRSTTGIPLEVAACPAALCRVDTDDKLDFAARHYALLDYAPLGTNTFQRQRALDQASKDGDWMFQLDTDEVSGDLVTFESPLLKSPLLEAIDRGFDALDYPAHTRYQRPHGNRFVESSTRGWRVAAGYPGPVAMRAGLSLSLCRQPPADRFRVDFRPADSADWQSHLSPVHQVVPERAGTYHFSWVRGEEYPRCKSPTSCPANDYDHRINQRHRRGATHPHGTLARSPFVMRHGAGRLRIPRVRDTVLNPLRSGAWSATRSWHGA